jgi:ABC-type nitrate/sulfonate/bicarbonate transport system ATPase subunit
MMGETGCGKTSLIRKLSELQNNGECNLIIDNIHAGHTNEDIIKFIEEKVIPEAKKLKEKEKLEKKNIKKINKFMKRKNCGYFLMN